jgi:hypothetical protein
MAAPRDARLKGDSPIFADTKIGTVPRKQMFPGRIAAEVVDGCLRLQMAR